LLEDVLAHSSMPLFFHPRLLALWVCNDCHVACESGCALQLHVGLQHAEESQAAADVGGAEGELAVPVRSEPSPSIGVREEPTPCSLEVELEAEVRRTRFIRALRYKFLNAPGLFFWLVCQLFR
jgi:hypothetical protein